MKRFAGVKGDGRPVHVGNPVDSAWGEIPDGVRVIAADAERVAAELDGAERLPPIVVRDDVEVCAALVERFPNAPLLVYTVADDPDVAVDASRLGVEYVSGRRLREDEETLGDRLRALGERAERNGHADPADSPTGDEALPEPDLLERFHRITTDRETDLAEKVDRLLRIGREELGVRIGYVSRIDGDSFSITDRLGGDEILDAIAETDLSNPDGSLPLGRTYCRKTVDAAEPVATTHASAEGWSGDPGYETFGLETYLGATVVVDGGVRGTLCFADEEPRDRPFSASERRFVELLAEWLGGEYERHQETERRRRATKRLEATLERIDDAFFSLDREWRFTYVNERAEELLERSPEELVGTVVWEEFPHLLDTKYERQYRRAMETQTSVSFEDYYEPLDVWASVSVYPSADGLSVYFRDVTERRRRERALRGLLETSKSLHLSEDRQGISDLVVDAAVGILEHEISGIRLFDEETERLELVSTSDRLTERFDGRPPRKPGDGVIGEAYSTGETRTCTDLHALDDDHDYADVRSAICAPLSTHGVLTVASTEPDAFDSTDVSIVELLATNAAAAMDRVDRERRLRVYESVLENVDDMVGVLDADGAVTYATRPVADWFGVPRFELLGRQLSDVLPPDAAAAIERARIRREAGGDDTTTEAEVAVERDGETHRAVVHFSPMPNRAETVISVTDVTELREARTELMRERDRFSHLFDRIPDPVIEVELNETESTVRRINRAFAEQFDHDPRAVSGQSLAVLDLHRNAEGAANIDDQVRENGSVTAEGKRWTIDGPREFLIRGFAYETAGQRRAFGIYTDITAQKRRERQLSITNRILRHNLRNELTVITGFAGLVATNTEDPEIERHARTIEETAERLAEVGEGASELQRIAGGSHKKLESVDVASAVARVVDAVDSGTTTRLTVDVSEDCRVLADDRLETALTELVENALEYAGDDPRIEIAAQRSADGRVVLTVADDGPGIPKEVHEVISGNQEITQLRHNSGVGLWIVRWVVDAYGGELAFEPGIDGEGTTVVVRLPAADDP